MPAARNRPTDDIALNRAWAERAFSATGAPDALPFSFRYGGRSLAELVAGWRRAERVQTVGRVRTRTLTLTDPATGLQVQAVAKTYLDTAGVDWTIHLANRGQRDTPVIEDIRSLDVTLPLQDMAPVLRKLHGSDCTVNDWIPSAEPLRPGSPVGMAPAGGRSSSGASPYFTVDLGDGGAVAGVGWSGQWSGSVERTEAGVRIRAGIQQVHLRLRPGETIRGPRILLVQWSGGDHERGENLFRHTMLKHIVPRDGRHPRFPPLVHLSTAFYELNDSTEANTLSHLDAIRGLGFEYFWLDAYWTHGGFPDGMGNYGFPLSRVEPPDRFPRGLRPVSDAARREGMGFVVWFEPERVAPRTRIAREHPDWVISLDGSGGGLLNLGNPEAREYLTRYLIEAIRAYGIGCLRIDFNIDPLGFWRHLDAKDPGRAGMAEIRYMEGLYQMWDDILRAHPHLFIDNCASGGRRIDLETCARSIPLWRTDATIDPLMQRNFDQAALQNQVMTAGLTRYVPFSVSGQMGAEPYPFRSGFNGGVPFCEDCHPASYPRDLLRRGIAEAKRIRRHCTGDFHPLVPVSTDARDWCAYQWHRNKEGDGLVMAFRRNQSPDVTRELALRQIERHGEYDVAVSPNYTRARWRRMSGEELSRLAVSSEKAPGSVVVEYRRAR